MMNLSSRDTIRGENIILIGDLNKHVGEIIPGNHKKCSFGGNLVKKLLNTGKFILVNASTGAMILINLASCPLGQIKEVVDTYPMPTKQNENNTNRTITTQFMIMDAKNTSSF